MTETPKKPFGEINLMNVRLAFADLYTAKSSSPSAPAQFGATFLISQGSKTDALVRQTIEAVAQEKFKDKAAEVLELVEDDTQIMCYISGDHKKKKRFDGFPGHMALSAKNKLQPNVLDAKGQPTKETDGLVYSGCYVNAKVQIWAQDNEHGKAIRATLLGVVYAGKGDAFGAARVSDVDELSDLISGVDAEDDLLG